MVVDYLGVSLTLRKPLTQFGMKVCFLNYKKLGSIVKYTISLNHCTKVLIIQDLNVKELCQSQLK